MRALGTADVGLVAAAVLTAALAASVVAKAAYIEDTLAFFRELVPSRDPLTVAGAVTGGEVLLLVLVLVLPAWGGGLAALWILAASAVLLRARRRLTSCGCFGRRTPIGARVWARNAALIVTGVAAWTMQPSAATSELSAAAVLGVTYVVGQESVALRGDSA